MPGIAPGPDEARRARLHEVAFENLPSGRVFVFDPDGRIVAAGGARTLTGGPVHGLVGLRASELLDPAEYARFEPALRAALGGNAVHREGRLRGVDVEYWLQPVRDGGGGVAFVVATAQNFTERKRAERELQEERERLVRVLDGSSDGYGELDLATGVCEVSRRWNEILGRPLELSSIGREEWTALIPPEDQAAILPEASAVLEGRQERLDVEHRVRRPDGSWAWIRTRAKSVSRDAAGKPLRLAGTITDITQHRKLSEERRAALAASEARYRNLHESMMDGFVQVGMDGVIQEANEVYRQMLGFAPAELRSLTHTQVTPERWHAEETRIVRDQVLPRGYSDVYEKEYRRKDGSVFPVELRTFLLRDQGRPVGMWAVVRDVTERNQLRDQLTNATRLAALGTLVAGVAHEINNPLAAAIASDGFAVDSLEEVLGRLHADDPLDRKALVGSLVEVLEALRDAQASGLRIGRIVKDMASFTRRDVPAGRSTVAEVVEQAIRWLPPSTRERVRLRLQLDGAGRIDLGVPSGLLAQAIVNLVNNSAAAMPGRRTGEVTIRTGLGAPGRTWLEVEDDGMGMTPEVMARIFDPFFWTRQTGSGSGLGLATAHSIVKSLGGSLSVRSEPGKGSTFRVELPVAAQRSPERAGAGEQEG